MARKDLVLGISFTMWFNLGIEELSLAVEEAIDPADNMLHGLISSIASLFVLSLYTVYFNSSIVPGADRMYLSVFLLLNGYKSHEHLWRQRDDGTRFGALNCRLLASFHSLMGCLLINWKRW